MIEIKPFGIMPDGKEVSEYTLMNGSGMQVSVINYGGIITSLKVPDRQNELVDVVLGYDNLDGYLNDTAYLGAIIGRVANRISNAKFSIDGKEYRVPANIGSNCLHGGDNGFNTAYWNIEPIIAENPSLKLSYLSADMEEGFPGNLQIDVTYTLKQNNSLEVSYMAETDKPTVLNLTQHTYFNLSGKLTQKILDHELMINADYFLPVNESVIPTGEYNSVENTPFDFRKIKPIGRDIKENDEQLALGGGYDHSFVINGKGQRLAAIVYEPKSGRTLQVITDQPAVQLYTGNFLSGDILAKGGDKYQKRCAFCLETQHFPDAPNQPDFPSIELKPGKTFTSKTIFSFSTR